MRRTCAVLTALLLSVLILPGWTGSRAVATTKVAPAGARPGPGKTAAACRAAKVAAHRHPHSKRAKHRVALACPKPKPRKSALKKAPVNAAPASDYVSESGTQLELDGAPFRFTGVNMYQGMSDFPVNIACGTTIYNLDNAFGKLAPNSVVRVWATQFQAINRNTGQLDWTPFDRFVNAATAHHIRLIMTLGEQAGVCDDGHWKDQAWYRGDYRLAFDDAHRGASPYSYWDWIHLVVPRYADNPTIAFWEPLNEPETADCAAGYAGSDCYGHGSCPGGNAELLRDWFTTIGGEIHRMAPHQLVSSGTIGNGECGDWQQFYAMMASSPGVDVLTVHDYDPTPLNPTMAQHLDQAQAANKPIVWEEVGTDAAPPGDDSCPTNTQDRANAFDAKLSTLFGYPQVAGFLAWNWIEQRGTGCDLEIDNADPLMQTLASYARG